MEGTCLADGEVCLHKTHWAALCCDKVWRMGGRVGQTLTTPLYSCSKLCPADEAREGGPSIQGHLGPPFSLVGRFFDVPVRPKSEEVTIVRAEI